MPKSATTSYPEIGGSPLWHQGSQASYAVKRRAANGLVRSELMKRFWNDFKRKGVSVCVSVCGLVVWMSWCTSLHADRDFFFFLHHEMEISPRKVMKMFKKVLHSLFRRIKPFHIYLDDERQRGDGNSRRDSRFLSTDGPLVPITACTEVLLLGPHDLLKRTDVGSGDSHREQRSYLNKKNINR